jgi:transketolase
VDHHTYCIVGDGCLMEGVSHEACSLAGTLGLGKLIVFYDDNLISLDGPTELSYTENVDERFNAYHWHVQYVDDGNDLAKIQQAINIAKEEKGKPSLIRLRTIIGYGSPKAGTKHVHGEALGKEATRKTKEFYGFNPDVDFAEPAEALADWGKAVPKGKEAHEAWNELFKKYQAAHPELAKTFDRIIKQELPKDYAKDIKPFPTEKAIATRTAGQVVLQGLGKVLPEMMGGAADLTSSQLPRRSQGQEHLLWCARVWHVRCGQRHGCAWRLHSVRLHVLRLQRLRAERHAYGRSDERSLAVCLHA